MFKFTRILLVLSFAMATQAMVVEASDMEGKTLYTQVNMHSLKGKVVTWVNYGVDAFIPVNTEVELLSDGGWSGVKFRLKDSGVTLKLKNHRNSGVTDEEWISKHLGTHKVNINKFSKMERSAIESGEVKVGMSKDAVIVSRGYPPAHKTPSLKSSSWLYWTTKWNKKQVKFDSNGKVSGIRD